jgi:hemerythrin superfamily protein
MGTLPRLFGTPRNPYKKVNMSASAINDLLDGAIKETRKKILTELEREIMKLLVKSDEIENLHIYPTDAGRNASIESRVYIRILTIIRSKKGGA